jgi:hypothetical protein
MFTELHLSTAIAWNERSTLPSLPGVYVISKSDTIYVGRTWGSGGLRDRIRAFNRSATTGASGHAGGVTFFETFGPEVSDLEIKVHVPIAINPDDKIMRPYIEYAERRLIWEHVARTGDLPTCNSE